MQIVLVPFMVVAFLNPQVSAEGVAEEQAIEATVAHYLDGLATGDVERIRVAFHPDAPMFQALASGKLRASTAAEFAAGRKPRVASPDERFRLISIDRTGAAAVAKVELDYPTVVFVDYLALVKVEGQWKIMAKISDRRVK